MLLEWCSSFHACARRVYVVDNLIPSHKLHVLAVLKSMNGDGGDGEW